MGKIWGRRKEWEREGRKKEGRREIGEKEEGRKERFWGSAGKKEGKEREGRKGLRGKGRGGCCWNLVLDFVNRYSS